MNTLAFSIEKAVFKKRFNMSLTALYLNFPNTPGFPALFRQREAANALKLSADSIIAAQQGAMRGNFYQKIHLFSSSFFIIRAAL